MHHLWAAKQAGHSTANHVCGCHCGGLHFRSGLRPILGALRSALPEFCKAWGWPALSGDTDGPPMCLKRSVGLRKVCVSHGNGEDCWDQAAVRMMQAKRGAARPQMDAGNGPAARQPRAAMLPPYAI